VCLEIREKDVRRIERKAEREWERAMKQGNSYDSIEDSKNQPLSKKTESEVKRLATKVHGSTERRYIGDEETTRVKPLIKSSSQVTNMNAYINKCQCSSSKFNESGGIFNCDLHRSINKSQINLS
jgi:hypothetical protein